MKASISRGSIQRRPTAESLATAIRFSGAVPDVAAKLAVTQLGSTCVNGAGPPLQYLTAMGLRKGPAADQFLATGIFGKNMLLRDTLRDGAVADLPTAGR
jgi:hypothetical protein